MANRRMFARSITKTGKFLKMPQSTRLLYYDLGMEADDDGVVEAFAVMRTTGASEDDLRVLVAKEYVTILNDDLLAYINDWNINNFIRSDRYTPSIHQEELKALEIPVKFTIPENVKKGNSDAGIPVGIPDGIPPVDPGKVRLSKDKLGKDKDTYMSDSDESGTPAKEVRHKHGTYKHVMLTDKQYEDLATEYGDSLTEAAIQAVDDYIEESGKKYKNHYLVIKRWGIDAGRKRKPAAAASTRTAEEEAALEEIFG